MVVVMSHARMYHRIDPQICCILFIPFSSRRGDLSGDGGIGVVRVNVLAEMNVGSLVVFLVGDGEIATRFSQYILGERVLPIAHRHNST